MSKKKHQHLPLKAWEVYEKADYPFTKEYSFGIFAGHHEGEARADVAQEREIDNPWRFLRSRRVYGPQADAAIEAYLDKGKYWRNTAKFARLQAQAAALNAQYPVGTPCKIIGCDEARGWPNGMTTVRTPAWVPSLSGVLVSVEGHAGGFGIEHIAPALPDEVYLPLPTDPAYAVLVHHATPAAQSAILR